MRTMPWWPRRLGVDVGEGDDGGRARQWVYPPLHTFGNRTPLLLGQAGEPRLASLL
jgi:hypothetical protein